MNDDQNNPVKDDQFPSKSLDDRMDDASDVVETDIDKIADDMTNEAEEAEDGEEVSLNNFHEDGDDMDENNGDAEHIIAGGIDEDTE